MDNKLPSPSDILEEEKVSTLPSPSDILGEEVKKKVSSEAISPSAENGVKESASKVPSTGYKYSWDDIKDVSLGELPAISTVSETPIPDDRKDIGISGRKLNLSQESSMSDIVPVEAVTTGVGEENKFIPQAIEPTTIAKARKSDANPLLTNYIEEKRARELVTQKPDYVVQHVSQIINGGKEFLKSGGKLVGSAIGLEKPQTWGEAAGSALGVIKGAADMAFGGISFTPEGALFNVGAETLPENVSNFLFVPVHSIAEIAGYHPKEGSLAEKAMTVGDLVVSIGMMHKGGDVYGRSDKEVKTPEQIKEVKDILNNATENDLHKALEENGYVPADKDAQTASFLNRSASTKIQQGDIIGAVKDLDAAISITEHPHVLKNLWSEKADIFSKLMQDKSLADKYVDILKGEDNSLNEVHDQDFFIEKYLEAKNKADSYVSIKPVESINPEVNHDKQRQEFVEKHTEDLSDAEKVEGIDYGKYFSNLYDRIFVDKPLKINTDATGRTEPNAGRDANTGGNTLIEKDNSKGGEQGSETAIRGPAEPSSGKAEPRKEIAEIERISLKDIPDTSFEVDGWEFKKNGKNISEIQLSTGKKTKITPVEFEDNYHEHLQREAQKVIEKKPLPLQNETGGKTKTESVQRKGAADNRKNGGLVKGEKAKEVRQGNRTPKAGRKIKNPRALEALNSEAISPREQVLQYFIGGEQIHPSAIKDLFGEKAHEERRSRIGITDSKNGLGIEALAHKLWEQRPEGDERFDTSDYRNAVEDVLREHFGTGKTIDELLGAREKQGNEFDMYNASHGIEPEIIDEARDWFDSLSEAEKEQYHNVETPPDNFDESHRIYENKKEVTKNDVLNQFLDDKDINSIRASLRKKAPDSYTLQILDELQEAKNNDNPVRDEVADFADNGINLNHIKNMLFEDGVFDSGKEIDHYFSQIGGLESEGIFKRLSGLKTEKEQALKELKEARDAFRKKGGLSSGGLEALPEFIAVVKAAIKAGYYTAKEFIENFKEDFPKHSSEQIEAAFNAVKDVNKKTSEKFKGIKPEVALSIERKRYDLTQKTLKNKLKVTFDKLYRGYVKHFEDVSGNAKEALRKAGGEETVMLKDIAAKSSGKASLKIEENDNKIFKGLKEDEIKDLGLILSAKRIIELDNISDKKLEPRKSHKGGSTKEFQEKMLEGLQDEDPKRYEKLEKSSDEYLKAQRELLNMKKDNGLVSKELYDSLLEQSMYNPRVYIQHLDEMGAAVNGGKKISVGDSGIKSLAEGSEGLVLEDPRLLLATSTAKTYALIEKNNAGKSLYEFAQENPDNGVAQKRPIIGQTKSGNPIYADIPSGKEVLHAMIDGNKKDMLVSKEFANEWVSSDPAISAALGEAVQWITGANLLRYTATGANPLFALANAPRDMAFIYFTTDVYSKVLPKALAQIHYDMAKVSKDAITRTGRYKDFISEGGSIELLTHQGRFLTTKGVTEGINKASHVLGYLGETSELLTRLAIRERGVENQTKDFVNKNDRNPNAEELKKIKEKATYDSINQLDFSQGGDWSKAMNKFVPYLNAAFQASRGLARAARKNPKEFAYKAGQLMTLAGGIAVYNASQEGYDQVDAGEKARNYIFMLGGLYNVDDQGRKHYKYLKIPKSQESQFISAIAENAVDYELLGKKPDKQIVDALGNQAPPIPFITTAPPIYEMIRTYQSNYDTYYDKSLWKEPVPFRETPPELQYHSGKTPQSYIELGKISKQISDATNGSTPVISPEKLRGSFGKVFVGAEKNPFITIPSKAFNLATEGMGISEKDALNKTLVDNLKDILGGVYGKFIGETYPKTDAEYQKALEDITRIKSESMREIELEKIKNQKP